MQKSKGSGFLKVCGILMIIGGGLSIIAAIVVGIAGLIAGNAIANTGAYTEGEVVGTVILIGAIIMLIGGVLELIAGIVGVKNHNKPEKAKACIGWGIVVLIINIISLVLTLIGGSSSALMIIVSIICGLALPVLYLIGSYLNKKSI